MTKPCTAPSGRGVPIVDCARATARCEALPAGHIPYSLRPTAADKATAWRAIEDAKARLRVTAGDDNRRSNGGRQRGAEVSAVTEQPPIADAVTVELETALELRRAGGDARALRRVLRRIEELLDA